MGYLGGKSRIAKDLSQIINSVGGGGTLVSLFCGSCAVESLVDCENKILNDSQPYLIELYKALQNGYELPEEVTREQYHYIKDHKDEDKALSGFVGFECSFGGKWFGGYAFNKNGRNYAVEGKKSITRIFEGIKNATFICSDYKDVKIPKNAVVYCDPPYEGTTAYANSKNFNSEEFWQYMREIGKKHTVFISEEKAPSGFKCIWQKEVRRTLDVNKQNMPVRIEKLWVYDKDYKGE